jgi:hypothetical protein
MLTARRQSLLGLGMAVVATAGMAREAQASVEAPLVAKGAKTLEELHAHLAKAPRRRDFKSVPMILDNRNLWDAEALDAVLHYAGGPKQSWDNTDLFGPWLNVMRNALNAQIYSFKHPDFLCASATHGTAQLALYDNFLWDKYQLATKMAGGNVTQNSFVTPPEAAAHDPNDLQNPRGAFSSRANSVGTLQHRGAVFLVCHNAIWEHCEKLIGSGVNPDNLSIEQMCAEFSNHLIPGAILTPGAVGTLVELVELASHGFAYAR